MSKWPLQSPLSVSCCPTPYFCTEMCKAPGDDPVLVHICALLGSESPPKAAQTQAQHSTDRDKLLIVLFSYFFGCWGEGIKHKSESDNRLNSKLSRLWDWELKQFSSSLVGHEMGSRVLRDALMCSQSSATPSLLSWRRVLAWRVQSVASQVQQSRKESSMVTPLFSFSLAIRSCVTGVCKTSGSA